MEHNEEFKEMCRRNGWKCTPQRQVVHAYMNANLCHPSVDQVWEYAKSVIPTITRESVYRILNELADAGTIYRMDKIESAHYDSVVKPHGHLVCEKCGNVTDFELSQLPQLPPMVQGGDVRHIEVRIAWFCPDCRQKMQEGN